MCLIAYVKAGNRIPEEYFRSAAHDNDDGIGIMSRDGVEKFLGRKMVKRAWRYTRRLHEANAEFAVHFRYATHGRVALINTHPFPTPDGNAYVMHNGVLSAYTPKDASGDISDTRNLVEVMVGVDVTGDPEYWEKLADHIGWSNKLCVMSRDGDFRIVNEMAGDWINGVWYSQTYSLPNYGWANKWDDGVSGYQTGGYYGRGYNNWGRYMANEYSNGVTVTGDDRTATALIPYEVKSAQEALERLDGEGYAMGSGTRSLPANTYTTGGSDTRAIDDALAAHFANEADDDEPTDICPSCETLHNDGPKCPICGFWDDSAAMLSAGMA